MLNRGEVMRPKILAAALGGLCMSVSLAHAETLKNVDLVFLIDSSGSMDVRGNILADRIGEVVTGIGLDPAIGSVQAGVVAFEDTAVLVQTITDDTVVLENSIDAIAYNTGGDELGLQAMGSVLPGGSLFNSIGWRANTVRSLVLLTDEHDEFHEDNGAPYSAFQNVLVNAGYLNNVIVMDKRGGSIDDKRCSVLGGNSNSEGCEYIATANPATGAAFDLIQFETDTNAFISGFVATKIGEIVNTPPVGNPNVIPLPAGVWLLLGALGSFGLARRRAS